MKYFSFPASLATGFLTKSLALLLLVLLLSSNVAFAQQTGQWKMETLYRSDGKVFHGLVQSERKGELEFIEVVRPPGKSMYLVVHYYNQRSVKSLRRLSRQERLKLLEKIGPLLKLRSRARIEAGRMEDIVLDETKEEGIIYRHYRGKWFTLLSTADDETTRRSIVRVDQVFQAYRQVLPPRVEQATNLRIVLYGSMVQYRNQLRRLKIDIENPAFYSPRENKIIAGSDLTKYTQRLAEIRTESEAIRRSYEKRNLEFPQKLTNIGTRMEIKGFSTTEVREEIRIRKAAWNREYLAGLKKLNEISRRNEAKFAEVTRQMFLRLNHEAFHAYLENYVYPQRLHCVPRWLNEGFAQVFEDGQLEDNTLRVDAPSRKMLQELKADLSGRKPLHLAELITAQPERFLVSHADGSSQRHYLYAWGLTYHLTFQRNVLGSEELESYVSTEGGKLAAVERFEKLVGMPLPKFEQQWRKAMRSLKPIPR